MRGRILAVAVLAATIYTTTADACGVERWAVKTLTDPAARSVNFKSQASSVTALNGLPAPSLSASTGRLPAEKQTYRVLATLVKYKLEADDDIHMVLENNGRTMIAEMPFLACTRGAQHRYAMFLARQKLEATYGPATRSWRTVGKPVVVTGVLFFDFDHGQTGVADNAVELHPVVGFRTA